jgi:hypothetical protein
MHKKLAADLTSLAHSILQLKNKEDVLELKQKAYEIYEKLAVLAYVDEYINTTPNATETKEEILVKLENVTVAVEEAIVVETIATKVEPAETKVIEEVVIEDEDELVVEFVVEDTDEHVIISLEEAQVSNEEILEQEVEEEKEEAILKVVEEILEQPFDDLEQTLFSTDDFVKSESDEKKTVTLEEELEDTISIDVAAEMFEKPTEKKSLNDTLQSNIQIGLNDRIAFVKNLFEGNQGDFNRVVSQLNTFKTEKEAKKFITKMIKPDYNWSNQEEYEERFMAIVARKFS